MSFDLSIMVPEQLQSAADADPALSLDIATRSLVIKHGIAGAIDRLRGMLKQLERGTVPLQLPFRARHVMDAAVEHFALTREDLMEGRNRRVAYQRQVAMYVARTAAKSSYPRLSRVFKRDHTTIMHGARLIAERLATGDQEAAADVMSVFTLARVKAQDEQARYRASSEALEGKAYS